MKTSLTIEDRKNQYATVRSNPTFSGNGFNGRFSQDGKTFNVKVRNSVDLNYVSLENAIESLQKAGEGLTNPTLEFDSYDDYGSYVTNTYVEGYRLGTEAEYKKASIALLNWINQRQDKEEWEIQKAKELLQSKGLL